MHANDNHQPSKGRETLLTLMLTAFGLGGFLVFLILVSGGFFFYVVLAVVGIAGLGYFHYLVWGFAMTQEVAEQQAHELAAQEAERSKNAPSNRTHHRRF